MQVIADAQAIDDKYARGEAITPLCGLPLAVKDAIDVEGYPTTCATPAFHGAACLFSHHRISLALTARVPPI